MNTTDEVYQIAINSLIPTAAKEAREKVRAKGMTNEKRPGKEAVYYNHDFFSEYFHQAMTRLGIEHKLRKA